MLSALHFCVPNCPHPGPTSATRSRGSAVGSRSGEGPQLTRDTPIAGVQGDVSTSPYLHRRGLQPPPGFSPFPLWRNKQNPGLPGGCGCAREALFLWGPPKAHRNKRVRNGPLWRRGQHSLSGTRWHTGTWRRPPCQLFAHPSAVTWHRDVLPPAGTWWAVPHQGGKASILLAAGGRGTRDRVRNRIVGGQAGPVRGRASGFRARSKLLRRQQAAPRPFLPAALS